MTYNVNLFFEKGLDYQTVCDAAEWFSRIPGPIKVTVMRRPIEIAKTQANVLEAATVHKVLHELRAAHQLPSESFVFLATATENDVRWFAKQDDDSPRTGFVHAEDYDWITTAPSSVICAHYILKGLFNALLTEGGVRWKKLMHMEVRGCFFDFCQNKSQLAFKLRTADVCGECMAVFRGIDLPDELLKQAVRILEAHRKLAINTGPLLEVEHAFAKWPYPVAVTKHKAVQANNQVLRFMLLLDHFDSLVRYMYIANEIADGRKVQIESKPSLGWWVDRLATASRNRELREIVRIAQAEKIVNLRNERRGHGWMNCNENDYRVHASALEVALQKIEAEAEPVLLKHRLVLLRNFVLQDGAVQVEFDHLVGSNAIHPKIEAKLSLGLGSCGLRSQGEIYLVDSEMQTFRSVSPYIVYDKCPACSHQRVLITDGGNRYIDPFIGHRVNLDAIETSSERRC